nr:glutamate receptor ionotropic, kainate 2-like [Leptinotarsa decemlineata]
MFVNFYSLAIFLSFQYLCQAKENVTLGILFNEDRSQSELPLNSTILSNNIQAKNSLIFSSNIQYLPSYDIFETSKAVCDLLNSGDGLITIFGPPTTVINPVIESICKTFEVPYISSSWRETTQDHSQTFLNFYPESGRLSRGIAAIVKSLEWNGFVLIYENEEGLIRLQEVLKLQTWERKNSQDFIRVEQLKGGPDYKYDIVIDAHTLDFSNLNTTANITTIRIFDYKSDEFRNVVFKWSLSQFQYYNRRNELTSNSIKTETVVFHDALLYLTEALNEMTTVSNNRISCFDSKKFPTGPALIDAIKNMDSLDTLTGPIKFDEYGNRVDFDLFLYNIVDEELIATWIGSNETLILARNYDETANAAVSNLKKIKVIVSTRLGEPYLMKVEAKNGEELVGNDRYEGFSKDLMDQIAELIDFKYELNLTHNNKYGSYDEEKKRWNGLVGDLLDKKAHLAICDLTITHQRQQVVDFSMPFMTLGVSILHKYPDKKETNTFAFLDPFATAVWIYSATLYLVVSVVLFFIARMTPGDWENPHPCEEHPSELENIWDIKNCHWATLGAIMNQGCDILPKGWSSRMALAMWWFFALIITNSYIANLTAFLTKDKMDPPIKNAEDLAKQNKIKYGMLEGGSTENFLRESNDSILSRMYINMKSQRPSVLEKDNKDGVLRVLTTKNGLYAFLMESTQIEYEIEEECKLKQVGGWLDSKSYGIAMPMNAPYRGAINKAVLKLQEVGNLTALKQKWWKEVRKEPSCEELRNKGKDEKEGDLDLIKTRGIFLVLVVGVSIGLAFGLVEFLWNVRNVSVEEHVSYFEALKLEMKFAANVWITRKKIKPVLSESSSEKSVRTDNKSRIHNFLNSASSFMNLNTIAQQ